jgi:diguanylate cyclase (GGDEF)-like protein
MRTGVVLLAEDSLVIRAMVRQQLEAQGHRVIEAVDGAQALLLCRASNPDVVLLDVEMPILDGYGVLEAVKGDPLLAMIPIVFLTAREDTDSVVRALELGAHDYLRKPFEPAELRARISAALRVKSLQDELQRRNEELDRLSRIDALTGLANRRHIVLECARLFAASRRRDEPVGACMLDIDRFKSINDTWGHPAGDAVLVAAAARIQAAIRAEDLVGRWGGEEFLVLLVAGSPETVFLVGERARTALAASPIALPDGTEVTVTVSVGCASARGGSPEELIARADGALYQAKHAGRNRTLAA